MKISNNTRLAVLLGKPLSQSLSVYLQNTAYQANGIDMIYLAEETEAEDLGPVLDGLRRINFAGCGVTKPYKVAVMEFLDALDPLCRKIGACNTIVHRDGKLVGYNTDAEGFYRSLTQDGGVTVKGGSFFCIGAGGAGRAICAALAHHGARNIYVTDRFSEASQTLCQQFCLEFSTRFEPVPFGHWGEVASCQAVLNASGVGMGTSVGQSPMPEEYFRMDQLYFDACYNPQKTQFLLLGERAGAPVLNGLGMLLHQGIAQIELWSGEKIDPDLLWPELLEQLDKA